jgi:hypothetical protein
LSDGLGLAFAAMSLIGAALAAVWIASGVYLGRAFHRRERSGESAELSPAPIQRSAKVAEQRT